MSSDESLSCEHLFLKARVGWFDRNKFVCVHCGFWTRRYDAVDRIMTRPIHLHMTVALPGFNVVGRGDCG